MQRPQERANRSKTATGVIGLLLPARRTPAPPAPPKEPDADGSLFQLICGIVPLLLAATLAGVDLLNPPRFDLLLFYVAAVVFAAWSGETKSAFLAALISSVGLMARELRQSEAQSLGWTNLWNVGAQLAMLLLLLFLVAKMRGYGRTMESQVRERTRSLESEIAERKEAEAQSHKMLQQLKQLADNIGDVFWMRNPDDLRMIYANPAFERVWGRTCRDLYQSPDLWVKTIHPEDRAMAVEAMRTRPITGEYDWSYRIVRPDKTIRRVRDRAFPIRDFSGKVIRIVGLTEDITERVTLEEKMLEVSDREQARMGQDLHDSLCQKLVALAFDCRSLEEKLVERSATEVASVQQMSELIDDVTTEARATARGLFPVQLESDGLASALQQLANGMSTRFKVDCRVEQTATVPIYDNTIATHLYRIAQEAVNNAVKHSKATSVVIRLATRDSRLELGIEDDGLGIPADGVRHRGMGLHIMEYRARTIGGTLSIARGAERGTIVTCIAPLPHKEI
jgi:PAS domain S-box-containing protein